MLGRPEGESGRPETETTGGGPRKKSSLGPCHGGVRVLVARRRRRREETERRLRTATTSGTSTVASASRSRRCLRGRADGGNRLTRLGGLDEQVRVDWGLAGEVRADRWPREARSSATGAPALPPDRQRGKGGSGREGRGEWG